MNATAKYQGIIFDLDGVICSTDEYHFEAWKAIAQQIGIHDFTRADNDRQRGVSRMESLEILLEKSDRSYTQREKQELAEHKNNLYLELLQKMNANNLSGEVKATLDTLRKTGFKLAIGSSSKNAKLILERLGLKNFFDAVSDGSCISKSKPDPEVFLIAASMLGLEPKSCLVVEDASAGISAGDAGGFDTAGINEAAKDPLTTYPICTFSQILDIVIN